MTEFVQVSENVVNAINEATKFNSTYISIGLRKNHFLIACEDIRSIFFAIPVEPTEHPEFAISVEKKILKEIIQRGQLQVSLSSDSKIITLSTYKYAKMDKPWLTVKIGYSYGPAVINLAKRLLETTHDPIQCPKELFSNEVVSLMDLTNASLNIKGNIAYSIGKGFSFYIELGEVNEHLTEMTFDAESVKFILKNLRPYTQFYISGNTYIMQSNNKYYTWRGMYQYEESIEEFLAKRPKAECDIQISNEVPYAFTKVSDKDEMMAMIDFRVKTLNLKTDSVSVITAIDISNEQGTEDLLTAKFNQRYLQYLAGATVKHMEIFKKFIRIRNKNNLITDIGCDTNFQK